jgi:hypothetical protein
MKREEVEQIAKEIAGGIVKDAVQQSAPPKIDLEMQRYNITIKILAGAFALLVVYSFVPIFVNMITGRALVDAKEYAGLVVTPLTGVVSFVVGFYFKDK